MLEIIDLILRNAGNVVLILFGASFFALIMSLVVSIIVDVIDILRS